MAEQLRLFTSMRFDWNLEPVRDMSSRIFDWNADMPSPFYMLDYHRDRMLKAAEHWGWTSAVKTIKGVDGLARLHSFLKETLEQEGRWDNLEQPLRLKILLSEDGQLALESNPVPKTSLSNLFPTALPAPDIEEGNQMEGWQLGPLNLVPVYDVYVDHNSTQESELTHFKTTKREMYDQARERACLKPTDVTKEVLIVNKETSLIMEGSLTTPYFWRGGRWVTPPVSWVLKDRVWEGYGGQDGTTRRWALKAGIAELEDVKVSDLVDDEPVWLSNGVRGFVFGRIRLSKP
ncbi:hypothetical protein M406DRAFT_268720 [Cryphonectria parasitica EP155]|uniref:Aminodeoxychorismate lyase n=1 Tax=Cryphonectria parasitica (strain ATCC 38755 / EP155) TaxID=660469 RepID=A0A9P4XTV7_CRYP1|nr:uncharacterized protein M406DRAFT_268720 [Cryphonectria parasitica EP155]KAF3760560.1 hypothetical protein M406DRAFT_268720 [Cryphonectria parasitica EP155]